MHASTGSRTGCDTHRRLNGGRPTGAACAAPLPGRQEPAAWRQRTGTAAPSSAPGASPSGRTRSRRPARRHGRRCRRPPLLPPRGLGPQPQALALGRRLQCSRPPGRERGPSSLGQGPASPPGWERARGIWQRGAVTWAPPGRATERARARAKPRALARGSWRPLQAETVPTTRAPTAPPPPHRMQRGFLARALPGARPQATLQEHCRNQGQDLAQLQGSRRRSPGRREAGPRPSGGAGESERQCESQH